MWLLLASSHVLGCKQTVLHEMQALLEGEGAWKAAVSAFGLAAAPVCSPCGLPVWSHL